MAASLLPCVVGGACREREEPCPASPRRGAAGPSAVGASSMCSHLTTPPWGPREAERTPAHTLPLGSFRLVGKGVVEAGFDGPVQSVKAQRRVLSMVLWATWVDFEG